ncbi:MAG: hypothetical protein Q9180_002686 [Flavoplaca navasiana]
MTSLQRGPHHAHIPRAIKRIITPAIRHLHQRLLYTLIPQLGRIHKIRGSEFLAPRLFPVINIHRYDLARSILHRSLNHRKSYTSGPEDRDGGIFLHARRHNSSAISRRDTATQNVRNNGILAESAGAHEMQQIFAFGFEARGAVGHDAFALGGADFAAQVRLAGFAEFAFAAFGRAGAGVSLTLL